ncbi:nucleotidyltransferase [Campylobacter sp. MIT 99-7217]|uniref:[protein-PII] uridylyltransferase family protein n=1 Tax=Campylobacter sp. MIT 99-7217 TaxID=535091 RepID=UPI00115B1D1A|nr:nucleotidyltransferase [Campylobacter sp. MIT 99-7217]TQR33718.1 nucleotidyltransferase [Campylobacter sp. MIT 99-7217]
MLEFSPLKQEFKEYQSYYLKHFLKQGSFSLYHSKEIDKLIKKAFHILLEDFFEDFFEDFLPENIPLCIIATKQYSDFKLCANEAINLLFIYKDIKGFNVKPMIKALISALNDLDLVIQAQICELNGLLSKNAHELDILGTRYLCGSKYLFKNAKEKFKLILDSKKNEYALNLFEYFQSNHVPFIKQEFSIQRDFGGLNDYANLDSLLALFKDSPKNYALHFISEKELSELRLAMDFLLSLKSAMNIQSKKDTDTLFLSELDELCTLMQKKDKKNLDAKESLLKKAMQSLHCVGIYTHFLAQKIKEKNYKTDFKIINENFTEKNGLLATNKNFTSLKSALKALLELEDKDYQIDMSLIFALKRIKINKKNLEESLSEFKQIFYKKHSFTILKALLDSSLLEILCKPFYETRFLLDEEHVLSRDENALLCLQEFERSFDEFEELKSLNEDERAVAKLSIFMSAIEEENEISLANIYRAYALKLDIKGDILEFGLKLFKNFKLMKDIILKEDIYNETIIFNLISRLEKPKYLKILYILTLINARALQDKNHFFYKSLDTLLANAKEGFLDESFLDESQRRVKKEQTLKRSKVFLEANTLLQDKITHIKSNLFFIKNSFEDIVKIAKIAQENEFKFWFNNDKNLIFEMCANSKLDLENILQALSHLNLIFMSFFPLFDDKFYLKFEYDNIISNEQKERLESLLSSNLQSKTKAKLKKPNIKKDELKFDFEYSKTYVKLNLNTKDEQGLMAYLMSVFNEFELILSAAKIQTIRQRTRNTFYFLKTPNLIENEEKILKTLISE